MRLLGSMGRSVSVAFTENTKCPSREQAGGMVNTRENVFCLHCLCKCYTKSLERNANLTVESVVAGGIRSIVAASQFVACVSRNALVATVHSQSSFYVTISR